MFRERAPAFEELGCRVSLVIEEYYFIELYVKITIEIYSEL